ncbi:unknown protein [Microcystis aeruginosa NIES-843]|uniref:Uncharacterized protein n=1 Tax=Microcystis aeruginosa (strain NIES-843 / IAM M-2473) TaxID=449447 RepID=B0JMQ1_MICAN|nr:unknown protein [Microcystis aeruginosa NIES-843]
MLPLTRNNRVTIALYTHLTRYKLKIITCLRKLIVIDYTGSLDQNLNRIYQCLSRCRGKGG